MMDKNTEQIATELLVPEASPEDAKRR